MLYFALGDAILTQEELSKPTTLTKIQDFFTQLDEGGIPTSISFPTGELTPQNVVRTIELREGAKRIDFKEIGIGAPLTIMIRDIYTGKYPGGGLFGNKKDLLVTSATKSMTAFDAKPCAVNYMVDSVSPRSHIARPAATKQGTPLVFYSPALMEKSLTLDLSMVFDQFPAEIFNMVGDTFIKSAGIPIFLQQSVYLLAAGVIAKIVGVAGEALFDGKPIFEASEPLNIYLPGEYPLEPGFALIASQNVDLIDKEFRLKFRINNEGRVVDMANGNPYDGDAPYIVISIDGTPQPEYSSFTPTAACAAIMSRFFGMKDGQAQPIDSLIDALKLYNDFTYRLDVDKLDKQIEGLPNGEEKDNLKMKREALAKNILTDLLQKT